MSTFLLDFYFYFYFFAVSLVEREKGAAEFQLLVVRQYGGLSTGFGPGLSLSVDFAI